MYLAVLVFGVVDYACDLYANPSEARHGNVVRLNVGLKFVTKLVRATAALIFHQQQPVKRKFGRNLRMGKCWNILGPHSLILNHGGLVLPTAPSLL